MNLISLLKLKLRPFVPDEADRPRPEPEGDLDMPPAPTLNQGMPVEVMKDFDTVLLFGRLNADSPKMLTIGRIPGENSFPVCRVGSAVLVRGYDAQMDPVLLLGRVVCSSGVQCVVGDLKNIPYETQRKGVRYPLTPPASVSVMDGAEPGQQQPCQLLNISASGACIVSEYSYQVDQPLHLWVELVEGPKHTAVYHCRVVRATPRSSSHFEYGLLFTQMDEDSRTELMRSIQAVRKETEKKLLR